jgi:hypothetical protein
VWWFWVGPERTGRKNQPALTLQTKRHPLLPEDPPRVITRAVEDTGSLYSRAERTISITGGISPLAKRFSRCGSYRQ